ncbi:MAG: hypothetical protein CM15mP103_13290 [Gammaproteobacteria bacterium]|nr:MAG: hypothetical protein CM15mP103_13290 [Gammaproteobacteria bacterium]
MSNIKGGVSLFGGLTSNGSAPGSHPDAPKPCSIRGDHQGMLSCGDRGLFRSVFFWERVLTLNNVSVQTVFENKLVSCRQLKSKLCRGPPTKQKGAGWAPALPPIGPLPKRCFST